MNLNQQAKPRRQKYKIKQNKKIGIFSDAGEKKRRGRNRKMGEEEREEREEGGGGGERGGDGGQGYSQYAYAFESAFAAARGTN